MDDNKITCPKCKGRKYKRVRIYYKEKTYYYYSKCGYCYFKGYLDWIQIARGRKPGIEGYFIDTHPAGSCIIASEKFGGSKIFDGRKYIPLTTERGEALWNELIGDPYGD